MRTMLIRAAVLLAVVTYFNWTTDLAGQSMSKNLTGPAASMEGMKSNTSPKWKEAKAEKPILHKFILPKTNEKGVDGEIVVKPIDGDAEEILAEIKKKWTPPEGKTFDSKDDKITFKKDAAKVGGGKATMMDIRGTYADGDKKAEKHRMVAIVYETKDKKYLFQAQGPIPLMAAQAGDFIAWVAAFK